MSNLGSGSGSSYPGAIDTQTLEVDSPNANKTKARAAVPNDLAAAAIAIETTLGTSPQGTKTNVKTFLQVQHNTDGTHKAITATTINASGTITGNLTGNVTGNATTSSSCTGNALTSSSCTGNAASATLFNGLTKGASGSHSFISISAGFSSSTAAGGSGGTAMLGTSNEFLIPTYDPAGFVKVTNVATSSQSGIAYWQIIF